MALGQEHDKSTKQWPAPFALIIGILWGAQSGLISGAAFLIGGLWLSPDLDTHSRALKRWGILKGLWWPYQKAIPHRSIFSHGPFLGTTLRVSYLLTLITLLCFCIKLIGFPEVLDNTFINELIKKYPRNFLALLLGLEASAWLHLIKDGDPISKEWSKKRHR